MPINDQGDEMRISGLGNTAKLQWLPDTPLFSYHTQEQTGPVVVDIVVVVFVVVVVVVVLVVVVVVIVVVVVLVVVV